MAKRSSRNNDSTNERRSISPVSWSADRPDVVALLQTAEIDSCGLIPWGSNYTFLISLEHPEAGCGRAVYKPRRGEAPLGDFPDGTLFRRERAAYLISEALGWSLVPPTVVRDGPYGIGMVQLYIDADTEAHYFTFGPEIVEEARRVAVFDCVINNTDRKGGHLLRDSSGRVWAIDHGLTFHTAPKLRTVIWDFAGEVISPPLLADLTALLAAFDEIDGPLGELRRLLSARECEALRRRIERLIESATYPHPISYRSVPWPQV